MVPQQAARDIETYIRKTIRYKLKESKKMLLQQAARDIETYIRKTIRYKL